MKTSAVRLVQEKLKELGFYKAKIDGDRGPKTNAAVLTALGAWAGDLPVGWREWSERRRAVAFLQLWCRDEGVEAGPIDGWWGPQTDFAFERLVEIRETGKAPRDWRDEQPLDGNPNKWPTQSKVASVFGPHGEPDAATPPPPLVKVPCPWTLKLSWNRNQTLSAITIHQKCAASLERILKRVHTHYGTDEIRRLRLDLFGGSYNPRKMRGSSKWSMHAWGIAIDWDPDRNRLKWGRDQASLAGREYLPWWRFWEEEGWVSLGRARNFDWMHVQAARLD